MQVCSVDLFFVMIYAAPLPLLLLLFIRVGGWAEGALVGGLADGARVGGREDDDERGTPASWTGARPAASCPPVGCSAQATIG